MPLPADFSSQRVERRRLASAIGAEQCEAIASVEAETHALDRQVASLFAALPMHGVNFLEVMHTHSQLPRRRLRDSSPLSRHIVVHYDFLLGLLRRKLLFAATTARGAFLERTALCHGKNARP